MCTLTHQDAVVERLRCRLGSLEKKLGMSFQEEHQETEDFVVDLTCEERDDVLTTETSNKTAAVSDQEVSESVSVNVSH